MSTSARLLLCLCFLPLLQAASGAPVGLMGLGSCSLSACDLSDTLQDELAAIREKLTHVVDYENKVEKLEFDVQVHLEEARLANPNWSPRTNHRSDETTDDDASPKNVDWSSDAWRSPRAHLDSKDIEERFSSVEHKLEQLSTTVYDKLDEYSQKMVDMETALKTMQKWVKTTDDAVRNVNDSVSAAIHQMQIKVKDTEKQLRQEIRQSIVVSNAGNSSATTGHAEELNKRHAKPSSEPSTSKPPTVQPVVLNSCSHHVTDSRLLARHNGHELPTTLIPSGGLVTFECRQNYWEIRGSATRRCWNGTWATSQPTCVRKPRDRNAGASVTTRLLQPMEELSPSSMLQPDELCTPDQTGNHRHPSNCTGFYICSPGHKPSWTPCPEGTFYNANSGICEWQRPEDCPPV